MDYNRARVSKEPPPPYNTDWKEKEYLKTHQNLKLSLAFNLPRSIRFNNVVITNLLPKRHTIIGEEGPPALKHLGPEIIHVRVTHRRGRRLDEVVYVHRVRGVLRPETRVLERGGVEGCDV